MKRIILTALDDNNKLWYEHLIPFILSLKETDYQGDIGVISYNLAETKIDALKQQGIQVFPASHRYPEILMDRQISAADIAEQFDYDVVALYDSDIWFPKKALTVFDQIKETDKLYCSYDIWECSFLYSCVSQAKRDYVGQAISKVKADNEFVWQAGVVIAHKAAWAAYREYAIEKLTDTENFFMAYGIDATLVNLYAVETGNVAFLPVKYNCPPAWGIRLNDRGYGIEYTFENELVEGLHVTRAHRKGGEYSYHKLFPKKYYEEGKKYRIRPYEDKGILPESIVERCIGDYQDPSLLSLEFMHTNGCAIVGFHHELPFANNALRFEVSGDSHIRFKNNSDSEQRLYFYAEPILNKEPCEEIYFAIQDESPRKVNVQQFLYLTLQPQQAVEFLVKELNVEDKHIRWVFPNLKLV